jgi:hypothetical protein
MKFDLHPGDTFVSLEADDRPAQPGQTFGIAWGQLLLGANRLPDSSLTTSTESEHFGVALLSAKSDEKRVLSFHYRERD